MPKIHKECSGIPNLNRLLIPQVRLILLDKIKDLSSHLFDDGYNYVSFDVVSLFTNVPIKRTIDISLKRIYTDKVISINLKKHSVKKLLVDACTKAFNGVIYEQRDAACMRSSLAPLLTNIIMADLEEKVIKTLVNDNAIKFYTRYVEDTLFVVKHEDVHRIQYLLNNFNLNLRFTINLSQNEVPHFLALQLSPDGISIFRKNTNTGLYAHFSSCAP